MNPTLGTDQWRFRTLNRPFVALTSLGFYLLLIGFSPVAGESGRPPLTPLPNQLLVQRGDTTVSTVTRPTRGISLGFVDGTLLFDADQLQPVAAWFGGFVRSTEQPYFGLYWHPAGPREADRTWFPILPIQLKLAGRETWSDFERPLESEVNTGSRFKGYQIGKSSIRLNYHLARGDVHVEVTEDVLLETRGPWEGVVRSWAFHGLPPGARVAWDFPTTGDLGYFGPNGLPVTLGADVAEAPVSGFRTNERILLFVASGGAGAQWESMATARRLISAPAQKGAPLLLRVDSWRQRDRGPTGAPTVETLAAFVQHAPKLIDAFDLPPKPPSPVPGYIAAAGEKLVATEEKVSPTRAAVNHQENIETFAAVKTRRVRLSIAATENKPAGIDEIEIYGPAALENLALRGTASASSVVSGYPIHQVSHLNDGRLGNEHSWVAGAVTAWVQIEWVEPVEVAKVVWARDRTGVCKDRLAVDYTVEVSSDGGNWSKVASSKDREPFRNAVAILPAASPGYTMQAIPAPFPGCRPSDVAFDADGVMYVLAITEGEVWRTRTPPEAHSDQVRWQKFASGLNHPLGLQIVNGHIYVAQKPEITELLDRDGDGVADHFRTVASGWGLSQGWHEYTFGLAVDREHNLWFGLNTGFFWTNPGYVNPGRYRGSILRIDHGTERLVEVAKGCRVPNGIASGPNGGIFFTDNQGDWIQSCKLAHVVPGRFYGHPEYKADALANDRSPTGPSAVWLPYNLSRSSSGPVHDNTEGKFGPFADQMFVGDVGYGANPGIMRVALERVDGEWQGACFRFIDNQPYGCERMKFGPDNQLYLASLTTGLSRIRFNGTEPLAIQSMHIRARGEGFILQLTRPLAMGTKLNPEQFRFRRYHYLYTGNYGSPEADIQKVPVTAAELSADRRRITLKLPVETYPIGMVYEMRADELLGEGGEELKHNQAWYTVQRLPH